MEPTAADPMAVLRLRTSEKWRTYPPDVLPMFVAEMDYPLAPAISEALHAAVDRGDTGYVDPADTGAAEAFADYASETWGWAPSPARMSLATDVSAVIVESLRRMIEPGDGVVITPPVYPPFWAVVTEAGGTVVEVPLVEGPGTDADDDAGGGLALDLPGIDRALARGARAVLLCNPHNPVGLVHRRETLAELSRIVDRHGATVVSDEIHAPLTLRGHPFTPYLTVSAAARNHGIAAVSGSKAFNLAGLKTAFFVTAGEPMTALVRSMPEEVTFRTGLFGVIATRAGFTDGRAWLDGTVAAIERNVDLLEAELAAKLPAVTFRRPEATYLAWLDMRALGWGDDPARYALEHARVALGNGPEFGIQGAGHARINLACAPETVVEAVDRLARAAGATAAKPRPH